ncbi:hypothetical protein FA15DRAFT_705421 [Coprinopsis marcescibilis]|uniref:C2 domain-containing protein n=1 Tax=Coprinopsis marcescibilis TaxID=230819 RepID=A0A5C3KSG5_COPMA|nr:hypothetical protein FA15DRAFT_705421 [Coprinopsis marcescibilis]
MTGKDGNQLNEREVADPITHLPIRIHDATDIELEKIPPPTSTADAKKGKTDPNHPRRPARAASNVDLMDELMREEFWWKDPVGDQRKARLQTALVAAAVAGLVPFAFYLVYGFFRVLFGGGPSLFTTTLVLIGCLLLSTVVAVAGLSFHLFQEEIPMKEGNENKAGGDPIRSLHHLKQQQGRDSDDPESAFWLNALLKSIWPIINPALFTAVCDMLEDSLQATLPALIHGVKVADIGQGSEPIRIIGIRCLDKGSATQDTGDLKAEEGDFVNLEIALAYRAKDTTASAGFRGRSANLHMLMQFWLAGGGFMLPVWVELTGILATARMRIQLTPNPPFLSLLTLTLLGQPKINLKCTPLAQRFLNVMDIPGLNGWLKSAIDMAVRDMVVAPRSMNVDLKATLMGVPVKDTDAVGVVVVTVRRALLKFGDRDEGVGSGSVVNKTVKAWREKHDTYVTVGWSKLGKPMWSTRIIPSATAPVWEETTVLLVTPQELDAQEGLRLQVWDSDRFTVDDLLGNVDVPLAHLIHDRSTHNSMTRRADRLMTDKGEPTKSEMTLTWECGFYDKTTLDEHRNDAEEIKKGVAKDAEKKLKEAITATELEKSEDPGQGGVPLKESETAILQSEIQQQKDEDLKEKSDEVITGDVPSLRYPSGIMAVRIEQITGLEIPNIKGSGVKGEEEQGGDGEEGNDLPSAYCTVVINHRKVYRTRTKMKEGNPYLDAKTEKFVRDWRNTTVVIAVRDNRLHENDPLLGVVVLPLYEIFQKHKTSIYEDSLPIVGGIGYGRVKFSLIFRSLKVRLPRRLRGWDVGTLEVFSGIRFVGCGEGEKEGDSDVRRELEGCKMTFKVGTGAGAVAGKGKGKMVPSSWTHHSHHKDIGNRGEATPRASGQTGQHSSSSVNDLNSNYSASFYSAPDLQHTGTSTDNAQPIGDETWVTQGRRPYVRLPVKSRYASCVVLEFKKHGGLVGAEQTVAFGTLWLKDVGDDEVVGVEVPVYLNSHRGVKESDVKGVKYASANADTPDGWGGAVVEGSGGSGSGSGHGHGPGHEGGDWEPRKRHDEDEGWGIEALEDKRRGAFEPLVKSENAIGMVRLEVCFHSGLSGYHEGMAKKDVGMRDVMRILDCVEGIHGQGKELVSGGETDGSSTTSASETGSRHDDSETLIEDEDDSIGVGLRRDSMTTFEDEDTKPHGRSSDAEGEGGRDIERKSSRKSLSGNIKGIQTHQKELHRKHRGLMQWKAARNMAWFGKGVEEKTAQIGKRIARPFVGHRDREIGIDTEV